MKFILLAMLILITTGCDEKISKEDVTKCEAATSKLSIAVNEAKKMELPCANSDPIVGCMPHEISNNVARETLYFLPFLEQEIALCSNLWSKEKSTEMYKLYKTNVEFIGKIPLTLEELKNNERKDYNGTIIGGKPVILQY
jgi:hypothetical protein